jgi:8-oxo-dGTP pyrophosphatase MutT (NUDIX family)
VLMVRRTSKASFGPGTWVFPGGRVDPEDAGAGGLDSLAAGRRAAVRETREEAGLDIDGDQLYPISRWCPDVIAPKRFLTWVFFGAAPQRADVVVDGGEIVDHRWIRPAQALADHAGGDFQLMTPTWVTLDLLSSQPDCASAIDAVRRGPVEQFNTRLGRQGEHRVAIWHGDAGYESGDLSLPGPRHRLALTPGGWHYERTPVTSGDQRL